MKNRLRHPVYLAVAACLGITVQVPAQGPIISLLKKYDAGRAQHAPAHATSDAGRIIEIQVELALLADPATCPYYIEAHVQGSELYLRGTVANDQVRAHAVKVARSQCPLKLVNQMKVGAVRVVPTRLPREQLQKSVQNVLRKSFARLNKDLQVRCDSRGYILVAGFVSSYEEKMRLSRELRNLPGCTCVLNRTNVLASSDSDVQSEKRAIVRKQAVPAKGMAPLPMATRTQSPIQRTSYTTPGSSISNQPVPATERPLPRPRDDVVAAAPPVIHKEEAAPEPAPRRFHLFNVLGDRPTAAPTKPFHYLGAPYVTRGIMLVPENSSQAELLQQKVCRACGKKPRDVDVQLMSQNHIAIQLHARNQAEVQEIGHRLDSVPELRSYQVDLQILVPAQ
jgi:hypothetical protein